MRTTQEIHRIVGSWALGVASVERVRLFGSRARGTDCLCSDVDLVIDVNAEAFNSGAEVFTLYREKWTLDLSSGLGLRAGLEHPDLVELWMAREIERDAIELYAR